MTNREIMPTATDKSGNKPVTLTRTNTPEKQSNSGLLGVRGKRSASRTSSKSRSAARAALKQVI
jgi:hypothetical protein